MSYKVVAKANLNVADGYAASPVIDVKQYEGDYTKQLVLTIYNGNELYEIPEDSTVTLKGTNNAGNGFSYTCTYSGAVVTAPLMRKMTAYSGDTICEINIQTLALGHAATANFKVHVRKAAVSAEDIAGSSEYQSIVEYVNNSHYYEQLSQSYAIGNSGIRDGEESDNALYYSIVSRELRDNVLAFVGSPYTARTAADMKVLEKIYVYVGSEANYTFGHWYYHDYEQNKWLDGGVYNSNAGYLIHPTVASMKANVTLNSEKTVRTLGREYAGDGSGALYKIVDSRPTGEYETLSNGKFAQLILTLTDKTLSKTNYTADAKATGDAITAEQNARISALNTERQERVASDNAITQNLNTEIQNRTAAVSAEETARIEADNALDEAKADKATTIAGYNISDAYTKTEIDALVSAVFDYKGTKATFADVQNVSTKKTGDVWFVTEDSAEYAWNGSKWEKLGPVIDLSPYITGLTISGLSLSSSATTITQAQLRTALGLGSAAYANTASSVTATNNLPTNNAVISYVASAIAESVTLPSDRKLEFIADANSIGIKFRAKTDTVGAGYAVVFIMTGTNAGRMEFRNYTNSTNYTNVSYTNKSS